MPKILAQILATHIQTNKCNTYDENKSRIIDRFKHVNNQEHRMSSKYVK